jgi:hypothetical protein
MPRARPSYAEEAGIKGSPLKYKWSADIGLKFYASKDANPRLLTALEAVTFRAAMSLGVAITEWGIWRLDGHADLTDALARVEAAWACSIDAAYAKDLKFTLSDGVHEDGDPIHGPLEICLAVLGELCARYSKNSIYIVGSVIRQAQLVRYILPDKAAFDEWLTSSLRRAAKTFPREATYDRKKGVFDPSAELPVPREFFEPGFDYSESASKAAISGFLKTLDPKKNPYLGAVKK